MNFVLSTSILLSITIHHVFSLSFIDRLYEGNSCPLEDGGIGICKKITDCPSRLKEVRAGKRNSSSKGRCGFDNFTEIVCCPLQDVSQKLGIRPADIACRQHDNEIDTGKNIVFHIYAGLEALPNEFPYVVALGYKDTDIEDKEAVKYSCGGTLISSQHVVTAAHCVSNVEERVPIEIRVGSNNLSKDSSDVQRITISKIIIHPKYKRSSVYNDIAVVRLQRPVRLSEKVKPICLQTKPIRNTTTSADTSFVVIGWGATGFAEDNSPVLLKTPNMSLIDHEQCESAYTGFEKMSSGVDESMICLMDRNETRRSDACEGDSGGPLLKLTNGSETILGITAFGQICGSAVPAVYMSIYFYLDWIESLVWPDIN